MLGESDKAHLPHPRRTSLGRCAAVIAAAIFAGVPGLALSATYYVDALAGSDSAAGTSTATAWKTLAKVNSKTFSAGDSILFQTGQRWTGQLHPLGSGASGNPITLSSYGSGAQPIIDGSSLSSGGTIYLLNQGYWTIDGFDVTSNSGRNNVGTTSVPGTNRSGIWVDNNSGGALRGIVIRNNHVHDVNGCFVCSGADAHNNGGIAVTADLMSPLSLGTSGYNGVLIENNHVDHVGRTGIVFDDWSTGLLYAINAAALSYNVTVRGNTVESVDSDGIVVSGSQNNLMERNVVGNAGLVTVANSTEPSSGGIWTTKSINTTIQYNEVYGVRTQVTDGQAFDADLLASNVTVQYNYSHDNQGGFMLMEGTNFAGTGLVVRYNLSVNDSWGGAKGVFTFAYGFPQNTSIYNNTIYVAAGLPSNLTYCDGWNCANTTITWNFRNNIIANLGSGGYNTPSGTTTTIDHNLFYGNHPTSEPADTSKITADPQFVAVPASSPYGIDAVSGFQLASGSPATSSGAVISNNGGQDYFGRKVSATAPATRGFHEIVNY